MNIRIFFYYIFRFLSRLIFGRNFLIRNKLATSIYRFFVSIVKFFSIAHRKQKKWEDENPYAPWLVPESISFIENWLKRDKKGFEFGSGRSTKWFTERSGFYFSVEGEIDWYHKIYNENKVYINSGKCKIVYREAGDQVNVDTNKVESYSNSLNMFKNEYFDFGLIDGHFRVECIKKSLKKIKKNGILIIDNTDAIDGINKYLNKFNHKKFSNSISETTILFMD